MLNPKQVIKQIIKIIRPLVCLTDVEKDTSTPLTAFKMIKIPTNRAIPSDPYSTVQLISADTMGTMETGCVIAGVGLQVKEHYKMVFRVNTFDDDAMFRTNTLRSQLRNPLVSSQLSEQGFGFVDVSETKNLTGLDDTKFEERARVDITLNVASGDLSQFTATAAGDIGKAGVRQFFDIEPVEIVNIDTFVGSGIEQTLTITKDP